MFKVTQFVNVCVTSGETKTETEADYECESLCNACTFVLLRNVTAIKIHWQRIFNGFIAVLA